MGGLRGDTCGHCRALIFFGIRKKEADSVANLQQERAAA